MDIVGSLPLVEHWRWVPRDIDLRKAPKAIAPGESFNLVPFMRTRGWLIKAFVWLDNPYAHWEIHYDDTNLDVSAHNLLLAGQIQPQNAGPWLARYNDEVTPNVFTILLTPSSPLEFREEFRVLVSNPSLRPDGSPNPVAHIYAYTVTTKEIMEPFSFVTSVRSLRL